MNGRHLARWIDFRSHQVFEEATIYTAIQVFTRAPNATLEIAFAADGDLGRVDWSNVDNRIPYAELAQDGGKWLLAPEPVRRLWTRLAADCRRLDDPEVTRGIIVGIQTSADYIYHLTWLANGRYLHTPPKEVLRDQIIVRQQAMTAVTAQLRGLEAELHMLTSRLFGLSDAERRLVERR